MKNKEKKLIENMKNLIGNYIGNHIGEKGNREFEYFEEEEDKVIFFFFNEFSEYVEVDREDIHKFEELEYEFIQTAA